MFNAIFKNWLTSILGSIAGAPQIVMGFMTKPINWPLILTGVSTFFLGLAAKDANVTGGTVKQ